VPTKHPRTLLDINYRSRQFAFRCTQISQLLAHKHEQLCEEMEIKKSEGEKLDEDHFFTRVVKTEQEARQQEKYVLAMYGILEGSNPRIAPLHRALAVWGLTADDIGVLSIHGTSTGVNEKNETAIWNDALKGIGRTEGNLVPIMA
jgi:fatty acid synthase subunit alpha, fungi type